MLEACVGQDAVADDNAEATGIEESLMRVADLVDNAGKANGVVGPPPRLSCLSYAKHHGTIGVGDLVVLNVGVCDPGASEDSEIGRDLLFEIHADAAAI